MRKAPLEILLFTWTICKTEEMKMHTKFLIRLSEDERTFEVFGGKHVTGWTEQMDCKVQYWEVCEHDAGTSPFMTVGHSFTSFKEQPLRHGIRLSFIQL
jgi:hypothetical protein